jgi:hypothetical protein
MKKAMEELNAKRASELLEHEQRTSNALVQQMEPRTILAEASVQPTQSLIKSEERNSYFYLHGMSEIMEDNFHVHLDNCTKITEKRQTQQKQAVKFMPRSISTQRNKI